MLILCYTFFLFLDLSHNFAFAFTSQDYSHALENSILFFEGQRSGKLPANQRLKWRGNSGLFDGSGSHVDLVGGYYDTGDNVKFGLPMAFTTTLLAWSVIEFGSSMHNQLDNAKEATRWSTDYLLKAATASPDTLYVQVGDPNQDHRCWERPEDTDTPCNVYKVSPQNPGSDVAAALAAASTVFKDSDPFILAFLINSTVFKDSDPSYSSTLLRTAQKVFAFADKYRGAYSDSLSSVSAHFTALILDTIIAFLIPLTITTLQNIRDELLWGASWLHRASQDSSYLSYIQSNGQTMGANDDDFSFSWDDKRPGTKIDYMGKSTQEFQAYKVHSDNYICSLIPGSPSLQAQYTPRQQFAIYCPFTFSPDLYLKSNGGAVSCGSSRFPAEKLTDLAKKQVDYILGDNPARISYMVGFGQKYPLRVHHRGSSLPSVKTHPGHTGCNEGFQSLYSGSPNPNVLVGAIVGGPDSRDNFEDDRNNYQQSEPATYINAPMVGALAFLSAESTRV
ncbi:unnamed protein product [Withania somnifera]